MTPDPHRWLSLAYANLHAAAAELRGAACLHGLPAGAQGDLVVLASAVGADVDVLLAIVDRHGLGDEHSNADMAGLAVLVAARGCCRRRLRDGLGLCRGGDLVGV